MQKKNFIPSEKVISTHQLFLSGLISFYGRLDLDEAPKSKSHNMLIANETKRKEAKQTKKPIFLNQTYLRKR